MVITLTQVENINKGIWQLLATKEVADIKLYNSPYVHWENDSEEMRAIFTANGVDYIYISRQERYSLLTALQVFAKVAHTLGVEQALKMVKSSEFDLYHMA